MKKTLALITLAFGYIPAGANAVIPENGKMTFDIKRNGSDFGRHEIVFEQNNGNIQSPILISI